MRIRNILSRGIDMALGRDRSRNIQPNRNKGAGSLLKVPDATTLNRMIAKAKSYDAAKKIAKENEAPTGYQYCPECFRLVRIRDDGKMTLHQVPGTDNKPWNRCRAQLEASVTNESKSPKAVAHRREYAKKYHARRKTKCTMCKTRDRLEDETVCIVCKLDGLQADLTPYDS